jgi:Transposase DDE domain
LNRHQFEAYLDKVFDFSARVAALPEGRLYPRHGWKKVFDALFLGAACQFPNVHRIEMECREGVLSQRIGPLSEDTMGYALERQASAPLFQLGCDLARQLKRNGVLHSDWARGRVVVAPDGIEICSSFVRCCDACLERRIEHKVGEELRKDIQYYHRLSAIVVVSGAFPIPLGIRFQKKGETEVACSLALFKDLREQLGARFFDLLVADALYLQTPFVQEIESLGCEWVINLKENQPELLAEAQQATAGAPHDQECDEKQELRLWHAPEVLWSVADRSIRVVKTLRTLHKKRVPLRPVDTEKKRKTKEAFQEDGLNFYATNVELGSVPPRFIHQLGRSRWMIDAEAFQTITTDSHLKQPSIHQGRGQAFVVLTMIRVLAYTLSIVFYYRQVRSHSRSAAIGFCDMARKLSYAFLFLATPHDSS